MAELWFYTFSTLSHTQTHSTNLTLRKGHITFDSNVNDRELLDEMNDFNLAAKYFIANGVGY